MSAVSHFGWSASQRASLRWILIALLVFFVVEFVRHPVYVSDPQPIVALRADELADRLDPNTADFDSLAALPTLGEKRAKMIVDYREHFHELLPRAGPAYQRPNDLLRVRGIGVATVNQLQPFLAFPTTAPTTDRTGQAER